MDNNIQNQMLQINNNNDNARFFGRDITNMQNKLTQDKKPFQTRQPGSRSISRNKESAPNHNNQQIIETINQQQKQNASNQEAVKPQAQDNNNNNNLKQEQRNRTNSVIEQPIDMKHVEQELKKIELEDKKKTQAVAEYQTEIFAYLREAEKKYAISSNYMSIQDDINSEMRLILVDWLVQVHYKFKLLPETLFMTISLVDRYIDKCKINRSQLQLLGISSLFIASKYEEIYPPNIREYVEVTDRSFSRQDITEMEGKIIAALQFQLTFPTALRFADRYCRLVNITENQKEYYLVRYLLELALLDHKFLKYSPSNQAASAIYLTNKIFHKEQPWPEVIAGHSKYTEKQVRVCARDMCHTLEDVSKMKYDAVKRKFQNKKFMEISLIQLDKTAKQ